MGLRLLFLSLGQKVVLVLATSFVLVSCSRIEDGLNRVREFESTLNTLEESSDSSASCHSERVVVPAGWYSGDTHEHFQQCNAVDALVTGQDLLNHMINDGLDFLSPQVWGAWTETDQEIIDEFYPLITGEQHSSTSGDPTRFMQTGLELSGFEEIGMFGHLQALNIDQTAAMSVFTGAGCPSGSGIGTFLEPVFQLLGDAPDSMVGYAHLYHTMLYQVDDGWPWADPTLAAFDIGTDTVCTSDRPMSFPVYYGKAGQRYGWTAHLDTAKQNIDYLEVVEMVKPLHPDSSDPRLGIGLYYKLLTAGLRVSIAAGTDSNCVNSYKKCRPRTYALLLPGEELNFTSWIRAIKAGRTSLANGQAHFMHMLVNGQEVGSEIALDSGVSQEVSVTATLYAADGVPTTETMEILFNGEVVGEQPAVLPTGGSHVFNLSFDATESGWIAARTKSQMVHTAAAYVMLDDLVIADCRAAEYFMIYTDSITTAWDVADAHGLGETMYGCQGNELRTFASEGRAIFKQLRDISLTQDPTQVLSEAEQQNQEVGNLHVEFSHPGAHEYLEAIKNPGIKTEDSQFECHGDQEFQTLAEVLAASQPGAHSHGGHSHSHDHQHER